MKFAKIIFFICVIGICSVSALGRAATKSEAEYTATTKSLRIRTGYKEMNFLQGDKSLEASVYQKNWPVKIRIGTEEFLTELQMPLLKLGSFLAGIPFYEKNGVQMSKSVMVKNFLKLNANTFYLPFNTISGQCFFMGGMMDGSKDDYSSLKCPMSNANGSNEMMVIYFTEVAGDYMDLQKFMFINQRIGMGQNDRKSFINEVFAKVNSAMYGVMSAQYNIDRINKSDADIKKLKLAGIAEMKVQLEKLLKDLIGLKSRKVVLSAELQTLKTTEANVQKKKTDKSTLKVSLEATIATLKDSMTSAQKIAKMTKEQGENMALLNYWLQGSVYHRMITEVEKGSLIGMVAKNTEFTTKITDLFFPQ
jgi:hypothetical protein